MSAIQEMIKELKEDVKAVLNLSKSLEGEELQKAEMIAKKIINNIDSKLV